MIMIMLKEIIKLLNKIITNNWRKIFKVFLVKLILVTVIKIKIFNKN